VKSRKRRVVKINEKRNQTLTTVKRIIILQLAILPEVKRMRVRAFILCLVAMTNHYQLTWDSVSVYFQYLWFHLLAYGAKFIW